MRTTVFAFVFGTVVVCAMPDSQLNAEEVLKITPKSGTIEFTGFKDDASHKGGFEKFSGTVNLEGVDLTKTKVVLKMDSGSLWSDHPSLTAHLLNEDFFHISKFPKAEFLSTAVRKAEPKDRKDAGNDKISHVVSGKLSFLGVTQKLDLPVELELAEGALSVRGVYNLDRTRFGMNYGLDKIHPGVLVEFSLKLPRKGSKGERE